MEYPRGLIRYTTENDLEGRPSKLLRPRTFGYGAVLLLMLAAITYTIATRIPLGLDVERDRGALFSFNGNGWVENSYTLIIRNMSEVPQNLNISVDKLETARLLTSSEIRLASGEHLTLPVVVEVDPDALTDINLPILFRVEAAADESLHAETESRFVGPRPR